MEQENNRIVYLTAEQVERLKKAARVDDNPQIYPFILIGLETGMRMMEILSTRLDDIHLEDHENPHIFIREAKAGADIQPITRHLADYLTWYLKHQRKESQVWLFPSPKSQTGHTINIVKSYKRVVKAAGLDPNEIVRHTHASHLHYAPCTKWGRHSHSQKDFSSQDNSNGRTVCAPK